MSKLGNVKTKILSNTSDLDITSDSITATVNLRENKIDDAVLVANDEAGRTYITNLSLGDRVTIKFSYADQGGVWKQIFEGIVVGLEPNLDAVTSEVCKAQLYAYPAIALNRMRATGQYSVNPFDLQTLREILVTGQFSYGQLGDFPFVEYFTEDAEVGEWESGSSITKETASPAVGTYYVKMKAPAGGSNYRFPLNMAAVHGFPLFIESHSNPRYDPATMLWTGIPILDFYIKRSNEGHNAEIQFRAEADDYARFQLTDQDHSSTQTNLNLIPSDGEWHHLQIPIGSKWASAPITADGHTTVQAYMKEGSGGNAVLGADLREYLSWDFIHSGNAGERQIWDDVADITFFFTGFGETYFSVDGLKITNMRYPLGIITNFVNQVLSLPGDSGYGINTDCVEQYANGQVVPYCKFIYEPITKCLGDIANLVAGVNWMANKGMGIHWRMVGKNLCVAPVRDHSLHGADLFLTSTVTQGTHNLFLSNSDASSLFVGENITIADDYHVQADVIDLITADQPNPGITTVHCLIEFAYTYGVPFHAHVSFAIDEVWPLASKYTEQKPLKVSQDVISTQFKHSEPEANFVIINGAYQTPPANAWLQYLNILGGYPADYLQGYANVGNGQYAATWFFWSVWPSNAYGPDRWKPTTNCVFGPKGIYVGVTGSLVGDTAHNYAELLLGSEIDLSLIKDPHLTFWFNSANLQTVEVRIFTNLTGGTGSAHPQVLGGDGGMGDYFWKQFPDLVNYPGTSFGGGVNGSGKEAKGWLRVDIPIGPAASGWNVTNHATWAKTIKAVVFKLVGGQFNGWAYMDYLNFNGQIVKAAKSSAAIAAQKGVKMKLVNEALASGYSVGAPDLDALDRIAVYECLRDRMSPVTGYVVLPFDPDLVGGQQVWLQSPSFGPNPKCFRIQTATQVYSANQGALTKIEVTDDLVNSYAKDPTDQVTQAIKAVSPNFQDRDYIRLKVANMEWDAPVAKIIDVDA